ncbi:MAG TPA: TetR family transcriptional regulator [Edaphobacter sp.]|nr:TetR family transcriptional regulator [Edaphobacter sp.]
MKLMKIKKSEETRTRILEAALAVFGERGFERSTMREIAGAAGVAVGAAYYYFDSKDAIVMAFYERSQEAMRPRIAALLDKSRTLEARLRAIVSTKFECFAPNRSLLGALSAHANPEHPLSPFSRETAAIREQDLMFFERAVAESEVKLPGNIRPYLPRLLWMYQMGLILFWVYDRSEKQERTMLLYEKTLKMILVTLKLAGIPLLRPIHRLAAELLEVIYGRVRPETSMHDQGKTTSQRGVNQHLNG